MLVMMRKATEAFQLLEAEQLPDEWVPRTGSRTSAKASHSP